MAGESIGRPRSDFYVYQLLVDGVPRYIGKGCGERFKEHLRTARRVARVRASGCKIRVSRFYNRLVRAIAQGADIKIEIIVSDLDEMSALGREREEIAKQRETPLWNTFEGGEGFNSEWIKKQWRNPQYRAKAATRSRSNWKDPSYRENQIRVRNSPEHRARVSASLKLALASADVRRRMSLKKKERLATDPEYLAKNIERLKSVRARAMRLSRQANKDMWKDPVRRAERIEKFKRGWADPVKRQEMRDRAIAQQTPERRKQTSDKVRALWRDPGYRAQQLKSRATVRSI